MAVDRKGERRRHRSRCHISGALLVEQVMNALDERNDRVVVIGGGLAGLTAAAYVARAGLPVTVMEGRGRLGGRATTDVRHGFRFDQGPHALYRGGAGERVLDELGVAMRGGQPSLRARIWFDGTAYAVPAGPSSLLFTRALGLREKAAIGALFARLPKLDVGALAETPLTSWIAEQAPTERSRQLLEATMRLSTYTHDPERLSADVAVMQLQLGLEHGVVYLDGGWQSLVDQLRATPGVTIERDRRLTELPDAPAIIVATGEPCAAGRLLDTEFETGPPAKASCLDLGLTARPRHDFMIGGDQPFYFSNHSSVAQHAPDGCWHVAAAQYLAPGDEPDRDAIRAFALAAGIAERSIVEERSLHAMTTITAIPTAELGGMAGRPTVRDTGHRHVFLAGDWVGPDGHLADASLASARAAAMAAVDVVERATWVG